jgi:hypothetical protein
MNSEFRIRDEKPFLHKGLSDFLLLAFWAFFAQNAVGFSDNSQAMFFILNSEF